MPAGMQVRDSSGVLQLDTSTFIGRYLAIIDASEMSGSATVPGLSEGEGFAVPIIGGSNNHGASSVFVTAPVCSFSGNTISWTRPEPALGDPVQDVSLLVGVK